MLPPSISRMGGYLSGRTEKEGAMLFPSEMYETEFVGGHEVTLPWRAEAIAECRRIEKRKRREVAKKGLTMHQAIEIALRRQ